MLLKDAPMKPKTLTMLLILPAFALVGIGSASAQDVGAKGDGSHREGGNFDRREGHGRGFHGPGYYRPGFGGYGFVGGYGYGGYGYGGYGYGGYDDWYGISSGHDECPLFNQRVMTPSGWSVRKIPVC
jgi:hypothetical protein